MIHMIKAGLNASQIAKVALFYDFYPTENSGTLPRNDDTISRSITAQLSKAINKIKEKIHKGDYYCLSIDETPDRHKSYGVTIVLYSFDGTKEPYTLELNFRDVGADNEGVIDLLLRALHNYGLNRDYCSTIPGDSAKYMITAWEGLRWTFRLAVPIYDMIHQVTNSVKKGM